MTERQLTTGTPSLLRAINARTILELIRRSGPIARAQVARDSGLSKPTVSLGLAALLEAGLVREVGRASGPRGPSAPLYEPHPEAGRGAGPHVRPPRVAAAIAHHRGTLPAP